MKITEIEVMDRFNKLYDKHLVNFNNPLTLSKNTVYKYKKCLKTLTKNKKIVPPSEYARFKSLTYRQYSYYRTALLQLLMLTMLKSDNYTYISKLINDYERIKYDTYKPAQAPDPEVDPKHYERVLRGLNNSNKQRKIPLSKSELEELAYNRIIEKQEKERKTRNTKARSLAGLPEDWQAKIRKHLPKQYYDIVLVVEATGCRPQEITNNPVLIKYNDNDTITVKIFGAKISEQMEYKGGRSKISRGQQWREISFAKYSDSYNKLFKLCKERNNRNIEIKSNFKLSTLQQTYRRAVKKAGFEKQKVSLYSNRHLLRCRMKTEGQNIIAIAQALGHQATSSTKKYGYIKEGSGGSGVIKTSAARTVRLSGKASPTFHHSMLRMMT
ncbi:MAG: hypothetical protein ACOCUV_02580 [bacterium]